MLIERQELDLADGDNFKPIRSVLRALSIIECIGDGVKGISEISKEIKLSKSTVFGLVKTLEQKNYIVQDRSSGAYRLGPSMLKLAIDSFERIDIVEISRTYLQALSDDIGEVTHLARREGFNATYLLRADSRTVHRNLILNSRVGSVSPLHCTSMGKIFLADMGEVEMQEFLEQDLTEYTTNTISCPEALKRECENVRTQGYALNLSEFEEGIAAIAVPIRDSTRRVVAAINCAMPSARGPEPQLMKYFEKLKHAAREIEAELGA